MASPVIGLLAIIGLVYLLGRILGWILYYVFDVGDP